jgi:D-sedoheptulose 7-phosphate isomerase
MDERQWLLDYFERYRESIFKPDVHERLIELKSLLISTQDRGKKTIIAGNGGSAAIASHCSVDFTKQARIRCVNFNESDLITCFANDYGYENWLQRALSFYADTGDTVILISSSGQSPNVLNAARYARQSQLPLVTFTGFLEDNPLKQLGELNFWLDSSAYNIVEMTHHIWLLAVCDLVIGRAEYGVNA